MHKFYIFIVFLCVLTTTEIHSSERTLIEKVSSLNNSLEQLTKALTQKAPSEPLKEKKVLKKNNESSYTFHNTEIKLITGNIIEQKNIDVIVNAANKAGILPSGVGGVAAAIVKKLTEKGRVAFNKDVRNRYPNLQEGAASNVGKAFAGTIIPETPLYKNGFRYLINAVGPDCRIPEDINHVAEAYRNSLVEAEKLGATSILFPRISAIIFGCNADLINQMAIDTIVSYISTHPTTSLKTIYFIFYDKQPKDLKALKQYTCILDRYTIDITPFFTSEEPSPECKTM